MHSNQTYFRLLKYPITYLCSTHLGLWLFARRLDNTATDKSVCLICRALRRLPYHLDLAVMEYLSISLQHERPAHYYNKHRLFSARQSFCNTKMFIN